MWPLFQNHYHPLLTTPAAAAESAPKTPNFPSPITVLSETIDSAVPHLSYSEPLSGIAYIVISVIYNKLP